MSAKQEFLEELRRHLRKYPSGDVDDFVEYYDELISERIEAGEKEAAVLGSIGSPKSIAASFRKDMAIDRAVRRPTVSNGMKALIAVLGVLSLPLLVPVVAVAGALLVTCAALLFAGVMVLFAGFLAGIVSIVDIVSLVVSGDAPVYMLPLVIGAALVVLALSYELTRGLVALVRYGVRLAVHRLTSRRSKNTGITREEA